MYLELMTLILMKAILKFSMINFKNFKNKKILITGHTGFKGSWLTLCLNFGAKYRSF